MKKGFIPVVLSVLLAGGALVGCGKEPGTQEKQTYNVSITNKDRLTSKWMITDPARKVEISTSPEVTASQLSSLINNGTIKITSSNTSVIQVVSAMLVPKATGSATITVKSGSSEDSVNVVIEDGIEVQDPVVDHAYKFAFKNSAGYTKFLMDEPSGFYWNSTEDYNYAVDLKLELIEGATNDYKYRLYYMSDAGVKTYLGVRATCGTDDNPAYADYHISNCYELESVEVDALDDSPYYGRVQTAWKFDVEHLGFVAYVETPEACQTLTNANGKKDKKTGDYLLGSSGTYKTWSLSNVECYGEDLSTYWGHIYEPEDVEPEWIQPTTVMFADDEETVRMETTGELDFTVLPADCNVKKVFTSSNPEVAKVDPKTGVVTPVSLGDATITLTVGDMSDTIVVHVLDADQDLFLLNIDRLGIKDTSYKDADPDNLPVINGVTFSWYQCYKASSGAIQMRYNEAKGQSHFENVTPFAKDLLTAIIEWSGSSSGVNGKIKVYYADNKDFTDASTVSVNIPSGENPSVPLSVPAGTRFFKLEHASTSTTLYIKQVTLLTRTITPEQVKFSKDTLDLPVGVTDKLAPSLSPIGATGEVTWSSENPSVATVDENGNVKGVSVGTSKITATVNGTEVSGYYTVNVTAIKITSVEGMFAEENKARDGVSLDAYYIGHCANVTSGIYVGVGNKALCVYDVAEMPEGYNDSGKALHIEGMFALSNDSYNIQHAVVTVVDAPQGLAPVVDLGNFTSTSTVDKTILNRKATVEGYVKSNDGSKNIYLAFKDDKTKDIQIYCDANKTTQAQKDAFAALIVGEYVKFEGIMTIYSSKAELTLPTVVVHNVNDVYSLTLDKQSLSFTGSTDSPVTLTATFAPVTYDGTVEWTTSDATVATVNNGVVTPVGDGECEISASIGGLTAKCAVTVGGEQGSAPQAIALSTDGGENVSAVKVVYGTGSEEVAAIKGGTSSKAGVAKVKVPSGAKKLQFYIAGWKDKTTAVTVSGLPGDQSTVINVTSDAGISGSVSTFTIATKNDAAFAKEINFESALTAETTLTITATTEYRFVIWGVTYTK